MNATLYVKQYRANPALIEQEAFIEKILYRHNGKEDWRESGDLNEYFREEVVDELYLDYSEADRPLILKLFEGEQQMCSKETTMTDIFRQICFMLYTVMKVEDVWRFVQAKHGTSFDASCGLDYTEMFGVGYEVAVDYYTQHPHPDYDVVKALREANDFERYSREEYLEEFRDYFKTED